MSMAGVGSILKQGDIEDNIDRDIVNFTESILVWNFTNNQSEWVKPVNSEMSSEELQTTRMSNVLYKFVDVYGYQLGVEQLPEMI